MKLERNYLNISRILQTISRLWKKRIPKERNLHCHVGHALKAGSIRQRETTAISGLKLVRRVVSKRAYFVHLHARAFTFCNNLLFIFASLDRVIRRGLRQFSEMNSGARRRMAKMYEPISRYSKPPSESCIYVIYIRAYIHVWCIYV